MKKISMFLDSGAFSAYTKDKTIDIDKYIAFIKEHSHCIDIYANLDVIGDQDASWRNQEYMESHGLDPLPVFHVEDDFKYLHKCIDEFDHFCLGGMAKSPTKERVDFLDRCFNIICDTPDRTPIAKVHGFGMTSLKLMLRYPWYSVDSTSWVLTSRMGAIYIPRKRGGEWIYDEDSWKITVSEKSPALEIEGRHITTLPKRVVKQLVEYLDEIGYSLEDAASDYKIRDEINIIYFVELERRFKKWPWPFIRTGVRRFEL